MEFYYPEGYWQHILVSDRGSHVGNIIRGMRINPKLLKRLTPEERAEISRYEKPGECIHLNQITLADGHHECKNLPQVLRKFERESFRQGYTSSIICFSPKVLDLLKPIDYEHVCYLESVDKYFLRKVLLSNSC